MNMNFNEICKQYITAINNVRRLTKEFKNDMESVEAAFTLEIAIEVKKESEKILLKAMDSKSFKTQDQIDGMKILKPYMRR